MFRRIVVAPRKAAAHASSSSRHLKLSLSPQAAAYQNTRAKVFSNSRMPAEHGGHANWEGAFKLFVVGSLFMSAMFYFRPASNPHDWARDEAEERNRRRAAGLPVEYGVNYAAIRYMKNSGAISEEEAEELEGGKEFAPFVPALQSSKNK